MSREYHIEFGEGPTNGRDWFIAILIATIMMCFIPMLVSCGRVPGGMTNEEIVKAVNYCKANGLEPHYYERVMLDDEVVDVKCFPPESKPSPSPLRGRSE